MTAQPSTAEALKRRLTALWIAGLTPAAGVTAALAAAGDPWAAAPAALLGVIFVGGAQARRELTAS